MGCKTAIRTETALSVQAQQVNGDFDWITPTENPYPAPDLRNVCHQYQCIRETFLAGAWAALVLVEHDNVLPDAGAIQRMYDTPADVVYTPYVFRHGGGLSTWQYINDTNLGMPLTQHPAELAQAREAGVWRVSGAGFGCTLIRRNVLERIAFRPDSGGQAPDIPFAQDCLRAGIAALANMTVQVGHYTAEGELLMPFWSQAMAQHQAVQTVNVMANGRFIALNAGDVYELTQQEADDLTRVGYVKRVSNAPVGDSDADVQAPADARAQPKKSAKPRRP